MVKRELAQANSTIELNDIERKTYAYLIVEYLLRGETTKPRFVLLGFDDIRNQLLIELAKNKIQAIEPEVSGRLKEASLLRGKTDESCAILISRQNLGKFASLTTAFKILEETIKVEGTSYENKTDLYNLTDVSEWLLGKGLNDIGNFIQKEVGKLPSPTDYSGIKVILDEIWKLAQKNPSFSIWLHPQRVTKALVASANEQRKDKPATVSFFLRNLGVEPTIALEDIPLFQNSISGQENLETLKATLLGFCRVLRYYVASDVASQRKNLADLCFNHLRMMIYELARAESLSAAGGKWTEVFCDFEYAFREKLKTRKKYQAEPRGVRIRNRSPVSGLPRRISVPLKATLEDETNRNLLKEFMTGELTEIMQEYSKLKKPSFSIKPEDLTASGKELRVEFSLIGKNGNIELNTYLDGLKSPASQINKLIATIGRKS